MKNLIYILIFIPSLLFSQETKNLEFIDVEPLVFEFPLNGESTFNFDIDSNIIYKINSILIGDYNSRVPPSFTIGLNGKNLIRKCASYYDGSNCQPNEVSYPIYLREGSHDLFAIWAGSSSDLKVELNGIKYIRK